MNSYRSKIYFSVILTFLVSFKFKLQPKHMPDHCEMLKKIVTVMVYTVTVTTKSLNFLKFYEID